MAKLERKQKEFLMLDLDLNLSNSELARLFGVSEGTIRYHRKIQKTKKEDGRTTRFSAVSRFSTAIESWVQDNLKSNHPKRKTIHSLYRNLRQFHKYDLSYDALRRYVRKHFPQLMEKSYGIRVESPPGKLAQVDWKEDMAVQFHTPGNWQKTNFFFNELSFSRKPVIIARERRDQHSFLSAHYESFQKLNGIPAYLRTDCLKTAVTNYYGNHRKMNEEYDRFLKKAGVIPFPSRPGTPTDKGKVEKKIQDIFRDIDFTKIVFRDMAHLQDFIDEKVQEFCERTICPVTGTTIQKAWEYERKYLCPIPADLPDVPVYSGSSKVQKDSTVYFQGNYYQIPEGFVAKTVRCINTGTKIQIYHSGNLLGDFPLIPESKGMLRLNPLAVETCTRPMSDLTKSFWLETAVRQMEIYQEASGVQQ